jgi:hypothetical protein
MSVSLKKYCSDSLHMSDQNAAEDSHGSEDECEHIELPLFPFPVFFLMKHQAPYVHKRVSQLNRQNLLEFADTVTPAKNLK